MGAELNEDWPGSCSDHRRWPLAALYAESTPLKFTTKTAPLSYAAFDHQYVPAIARCHRVEPSVSDSANRVVPYPSESRTVTKTVPFAMSGYEIG